MRLGMEPAPLMLGFILGPMLEENFRRAMLLSRGDFSTFVTRPISGTLFGVIGLIVVWQLVSFMRNSRKKDAPALHTQEEYSRRTPLASGVLTRRGAQLMFSIPPGSPGVAAADTSIGASAPPPRPVATARGECRRP